MAAEFSKVIQVDDPTANEMKSQIWDTIWSLSGNLTSLQIGELVVFFTGHGRPTGIMGVDNEVVTQEELRDLAHFGEDWGVHLVYILDTCRAGNLVGLGQEEALGDVGERISSLPAGDQKNAQSLFAFAQKNYKNHNPSD